MEDKRTEEEGKTLYEVGYHLLPTISEDQVASYVENIKKLIEKNGGKVSSEGAPVSTELEYTMEKVLDNKHIQYTSSYFGWMKFSMEDGEGVVKLKDSLDKDDNLLRFLLISVPATSETEQRTILTETKPQEKKTISAPRVEEVSAPVSDTELEKSIEKMGV